MEEIRNFGHLLSFLINLEKDSFTYYKNLDEIFKTKKQILTEDFNNFAEENKKRKILLERIRIENINEMLLQPIEDLKTDVSINLQLDKVKEIKDLIEDAINLEEKIYKFYDIASKKSHLILAEATRHFDKLAEGNKNRILKLKLSDKKL